MPAITLATARQTLWKYAPGEDGTAVPFISATDADESAHDDVINQVIERFITSGRWRGLEVRARFRVYQNQITLPSTLDSIEGVTPIRGVDQDEDWNNVSPLAVYGTRHEFLVNGPGNPATYGMDGVVDLGNDFATFFEPGGEFTIKVVSDANETSKTILLRGLDPEFAQIYTGSTEGESVAVDESPGATSAATFTTLNSWVKSAATLGVVKLYSIDTTSAETTLLAIIPPSKLVSGYHRYRVPTAIWGDTVECLCKRAFLPAVVDNDILMVSHIGALKLAMMALQYEDKNDLERADKYMTRALDLLDKDTEEYQGDEQYTVQFDDQFGAGSIPAFM